MPIPNETVYCGFIWNRHYKIVKIETWSIGARRDISEPLPIIDGNGFYRNIAASI